MSLAVYFQDLFGSGSSFSGRTPDVGGAYSALAGSLSDYPISGGDFNVPYLAGTVPQAVSAAVGAMTPAYSLKIIYRATIAGSTDNTEAALQLRVRDQDDIDRLSVDITAGKYSGTPSHICNTNVIFDASGSETPPTLVISTNDVAIEPADGVDHTLEIRGSSSATAVYFDDVLLASSGEAMPTLTAESVFLYAFRNDASATTLAVRSIELTEIADDAPFWTAFVKSREVVV